MDALGGDDPFIMEADGKCQLFVPVRPEGRPAADLLRAGGKPGAQSGLRPAVQSRRPSCGQRQGNELHAPEDPRFPYVFTTYRLTELHCGGIIGRVTPHTAELQPEAFVEISPELAPRAWHSQPGLDRVVHLAWLRSRCGRMVTERMRPFRIDGPDGASGRHAVGVSAGRDTPAATSPTCCWRSPGMRTPASTPPRRSPAVLRPGRLAKPGGADPCRLKPRRARPWRQWTRRWQRSRTRKVHTFSAAAQ